MNYKQMFLYCMLVFTMTVHSQSFNEDTLAVEDILRFSNTVTDWEWHCKTEIINNEPRVIWFVTPPHTQPPYIDTILPVIKKLTELREFQFMYSRIRTLPEEFCELPKLESIIFDYCGTITHLPENMGKLSTLKNYSATSTDAYKGFPLPLLNCKNLERLRLGRITYDIPDKIDNLNKLNYLELRVQKDDITTSPNFYNLTNLDTLIFLRPTINMSKKISQLKNLRYLEYTYWGLTLPEEIGQLSKLEAIALKSTKLNKLPNSFGNLVNLKRINIERNFLTDLPESILKLTPDTVNVRYNYLNPAKLSKEKIAWLNKYSPGWENYQAIVKVGTTTHLKPNTLPIKQVKNSLIIKTPDVLQGDIFISLHTVNGQVIYKKSKVNSKVTVVDGKKLSGVYIVTVKNKWYTIRKRVRF